MRITITVLRKYIGWKIVKIRASRLACKLYFRGEFGHNIQIRQLVQHNPYFEVFHSLHSHIIKHLYNHTNQMHNIYSLLMFAVFLLNVSVLPTPSSGRIRALYLKKRCFCAAKHYSTSHSPETRTKTD
jgi:hypothetical protein